MFKVAISLPTGQMYVGGIFVEHSHDIFPEHSEKVPYEIPGNIPWMFHEYPTNVTWIFLGASRNAIVVFSSR